MNRYWLKIVAGALVVFGVGLVFVRVGHRTIETVQTITDSDASISVPLFGLVGFRVDGQRQGEIRRITVERDAPDQVSALRIIVRRDSGDAALLTPCTFTLRDPDQIDENAEFVCLTVDSAIATMQPFGVVEIAGPGGAQVVRPIVLPAEVINRWRERDGEPVDPELIERMTDSLHANVDSIASRAVEDAMRAAAAATATAEGATGNVRVEVNSPPAAPAAAPKPAP